jgi:tetratricopeptide (TPR) repeat protein
MKHLITAALLAAPLIASAQKLPQPSPLCKIEQVVGLTTIKIEYSRPSMKDRAIFGDIVPYGEVWRTGANKCTTIEFDTPVIMAGQPVKAGKYSLFTIPGPEMWVLILNRNTELWGADERKQEEDVFMAKLQPKKPADQVETLTFDFTMGRRDDAILNLTWEATWLPIPIVADCTDQALKNIEEALSMDDVKYNAYSSSARFCVDRQVRLKEALAWAEKSVSMEKKYWNTYTLGLARAANGNFKEAIEAANMSMELAQAEKDANYVKMNRERIEEWTKAMAAPQKAGDKPKK